MHCDFDKVNNIILAYPRSFKNDFNKVSTVIEELICKIPKEINIQLILSSDNDLDFIHQRIDTDRKIETIIIKDWDEIWLRDCLGFINGNKLVKPIYFPMYCDYRYRWNYFKKINALSKEVINSFIGSDIIDIPLIWDGGNLVSNGEYGLLTSKVIEDNPTFNRYYIERIIEDYLDVKPMIIPRQKDDVIGHVDGYALFINQKTLAISKYPNMAFLQEDNVYLEELVSQAQNRGLETIRVFDRPVDQSIRCNCKKKRRSGCYSVSKGVYINNLILNDTVILPQYSLPTKRETIFYNQANKEIYEQAGYKVQSVNCDQLSQFGGSLHCLSFTY